MKMIYLKNFIHHFITITKHKLLVQKGCFSLGLYWQGLMHDLSKYSPQEFVGGIKFYQGYRSPNNAEREAIGYSAAWMHHKGRNKHHYEYWIDYSPEGTGYYEPVKMPTRYVIEMFVDRVAASKNYGGEAYTNAAPYDYFQRGKDKIVMHETTKKQLELLLKMLRDQGEEETFQFIRTHILKKKAK